MNKLLRTPIRSIVGAASLVASGILPAWAADIRTECQSHQITACNEILRANPSDASALGNRGIGFRIAGDYARAIADFDAAIRLKPGIAGYYLERALALDAVGEHQLALSDFDEALSRDRTLVQAHFGRAVALEAAGQQELSMLSISNAIRLDRNMVGALFMQRGYELKAAHRHDEAISAFGKAIDINPLWPLAYCGRAATFDDQGKAGNAIADYRKCIEFSANSELVMQRQQEARQRLTILSAP
jgi:tetratricopeptide (TPR) repeat protein